MAKDCCWTLLFDHIADRALACCVTCHTLMQRGRPYPPHPPTEVTKRIEEISAKVRAGLPPLSTAGHERMTL